MTDKSQINRHISVTTATARTQKTLYDASNVTSVQTINSYKQTKPSNYWRIFEYLSSKRLRQ